MNAEQTNNIKLSENIIIADADYIDYVAFQLSVQFERMIGRRIPPADLSQWIVNIALDGGLRQDGTKHETQVILIHEKDKNKLDNYVPSDYEKELNGQAFEDPQFGEFLINAFSVENIVSKDEYICDLIKTIVEHEEVKRIMIIPNGEQGDSYDIIRQVLRPVDNNQRITVFAMQPIAGGNFRQEILGYSLLNALGIKADEIPGNNY